MNVNKVFLNDDNIIEIKVVGKQDETSVEHMGRELRLLISQCRAAKEPTLILDDITEIATVDTGGRKMVIELGKKLAYDRLAMVGKGGLLQLSANFLLHAMGRANKVKYLDDRQKAIEWLKAYKEE